MFGLMTNVTDAFEASKQAYQPKTEAIALDLGLKTLFATSEGDLLGRDWLTRLREYDHKITQLARYRQQHRLKTSSARYKRYVAQLRGFIKTEVGRILNRLVETRVPAEIVVERLEFRNPNLTRRLNRLLSHFGKAEVARKLADLKERFGILITEVNPAYSSQEDYGCGYVDKRNRPQQEKFCCRWCGAKRHADVNAAKVLLARRSRGQQYLGFAKQAVLAEQVRLFSERFSSMKGHAPDPRMSNPYFRKFANTSVMLSDSNFQP